MKRKGNKQDESRCIECRFWVKNDCSKEWETTADTSIEECDDFKPRANDQNKARKLAKILGSYEAEDIVAALVLVDLEHATKVQIIADMRQHIDVKKVAYGQIVKVAHEGKHKWACIIGGGQQLKVWFIGQGRRIYWAVDWLSVLEIGRAHV